MFRLAKFLALIALLVGYGMIVQKYQYSVDQKRIERLFLEQWVHQNEKRNSRILLKYKRLCTGNYLAEKQAKEPGYNKFQCAKEHASPELEYLLREATFLLEYDRLGMYKQFLEDAQTRIKKDAM